LKVFILKGNFVNNQIFYMHNTRWDKLALKILVIFMVVVGGCGSIEFKSQWRNQTIIIDGDNNDWQDKTWIIKDLPNVVVGFMNDDKDLYFSLTISDRSLQRQIAFRGLTVWFDRTGGDEKKFGVRFPLGMGMIDMPIDRNRPPEGYERMRDSIPIFTEQLSNEIEIYGPMEGEHQRLRVQESGIEVALRTTNGLLIYEMKISLEANGLKPYAIGTMAGSMIGIGVETENNGIRNERNGRPMLDGGNPGEPPEGNRRGGFEGRRGGRHGGDEKPDGTRSVREPLKLWAKVQLAVQDSTSH
jgi:hypothetical protein